MVRFASLIAILVLLSADCLAGREANAIVQAFPKTIILDSSVGTIGGNRYLAAIILDESQSAIALVVFRPDHVSNYKFHSRSGWWDRHQRQHSESVKVRNNSVYFSYAGNGGCCSDYFWQYQFKLRDGKFSLVGLQSSNTGFEPKEDSNGISTEGRTVSYRYGSSINYLTGVITHWRIQAPSSSESHDAVFKDDIFKIKLGKTRVEKRFNFVPTKIYLLDGFDIGSTAEGSEFSKELERLPGLGYFDQRFKYHEP